MQPLEKYKVPTKPFATLLARYLHENDLDMDKFSERCELDKNSLYKILLRKKIRFDLADTIVAKSYGNMVWHSDDFREIYWQGDVPPDPLKSQRCARRGCQKWFALGGENARRDHQKYCSQACKIRESRYRLKKTAPREEMCRNRHPRTPENTEIGSRGEKRCKICRLTSQRRSRKRETAEQRENRLAYHRRYNA